MATRLILLLFLCFYQHNIGFSQFENKVYWNYDISDGLPTNSLYHILIDHTDRIWFGSDYGVTCFDGKTFKTYTVEDGLLDNTVIRCYEDSLHRIWFQHVSSLPTFFYNGKIHQLKNTDQSINIPTVSFFIERKKGELAIGGDKNGIGGLLVINKNLSTNFIQSGTEYQIQTIGANDSTVFYVSDKYGTSIINRYFNQKVKKNFWSSKIHQNIKFDLDLGAFMRSAKYFEFNDTILASQYQFKKVYQIFVKDQSRFFATSNGIFEFRRFRNQWRFYNHYLKDVIFVSVDVDSDGNIWGTTLNSGLYKIPRLHYNQIKLKSDQRFYYSVEYKNQIYLEGENLDFSVLKEDQIYPSFADVNFRKSSKIYRSFDFHFYKNFRIYLNDKKWFLLDTKLKKESLISYPSKQIGYTKIYKSKISNSSFIFYSNSAIGGFDADRRPYIIEQYSISLGRIKCVTELDCNLFVGTQKGLFMQDSKIKTEFYPVFESVLGNSRISSLYSKSGTLFIATGDKGMYTYNHKRKTLTPWKKGVLSKAVKGIYPGKNNSFWVHTDIGLQQFSFYQGDWHETQRLDLKTILKVNDLVNVHEIDNILFIITDNTVYTIPFQRKKILKKINLTLGAIKINEVIHEPKSKLQLKYFENNLSFIFSCVNHSAHPATLSYRINGGPWLANNGEVFNFSSLSAGEYVFDFKASSPFYATNYILGQKIKIDRKWWQTNTAIFVAFLLSTSLIVTIVRWRIIKSQEKKRRSLSNELFSLQSQMNPHFTFNSLNSVQSYLSTNDKRSAQIYLADFAILMRKIMDQAKLNLISLNEEIDFLRNYLNLEMRRLEGAFDYEITYDEELNTENTFVPSLMLQPFIENAVWHGVAALSYKGKIEISFQKINDQLICKIIDNGMGIDENKKQKPFHKSAGINNVRERMRLFEELFNKKIELEIIDLKQNNSHGICVQIIIPKLTLENKLT